MTSLPDELTSPVRTSSIVHELLDTHDQVLGVIDGVTGGTLTWAAGKAVKVGGSLTVDDTQGIDWMHARVRITRTVNGHSWTRGIYVPSAPQEAWVMGRRSWTVEILGKLTLLDQDKRGAWIGIPAGTSGVGKVRQLLADAGHDRVAITDSDLSLRTDLVFEPNASLLTVCNAILAAIGYWSLSADGDGVFTSAPYRRPGERTPRYEWLDDSRGIVVDSFTVDRDIYSIPNRVIVPGVSTEGTPALVGIAQNIDPDSPYSIPARGMIVPWSPDTQSDAATQEVIDAEAARYLADKSAATATVPVTHAPVPIDLNDVVRWRRTPAGIDARWSIQGITEPLDIHEDMTSELKEVVM